MRRVVLYKSGIGYFEHVGLVAGDQTLSIDLTSGQLDDVLKSLTTLDLGGGRISGITYNTEAPLAQRLSTLRLSLGESASRATLFDALRGARVEVRRRRGSRARAEPRIASGRATVVDDGRRDRRRDRGRRRPDVRAPPRRRRCGWLSRSAAAGRTVPRSRRLDARAGSASHGDCHSGSGERQVFVSYVSAVPVWKTTYRLVVPSKAEQQAAAAGMGNRRQHARRGLAERRALARRGRAAVVRAADLAAVLPAAPHRRSAAARAAHAAGPSAAHSRPADLGLSGRVTDVNGGPLPGATVRVEDGGRAVAQAIAAGDGAYTLSGVPPGRVHGPGRASRGSTRSRERS